MWRKKDRQKKIVEGGSSVNARRARNEGNVQINPFFVEQTKQNEKKLWARSPLSWKAKQKQTQRGRVCKRASLVPQSNPTTTRSTT